MSHELNSAMAVIGIDIGKNSFHLVGLDKRGAIVVTECPQSATEMMGANTGLHADQAG